MPASRQRSIWRRASSTWVSPMIECAPVPPNVMVPNPSAETCKPLEPSRRISMLKSFLPRQAGGQRVTIGPRWPIPGNNNARAEARAAREPHRSPDARRRSGGGDSDRRRARGGKSALRLSVEVGRQWTGQQGVDVVLQVVRVDRADDGGVHGRVADREAQDE